MYLFGVGVVCFRGSIMEWWLKTKWRNQLIMAVALSVFGTAVYWYEYVKRPNDERTQFQNKRVFQIKDKQVSKISILEGTNRITFECLDLDQDLCKSSDQSKWKMTSPRTGSADNTKVNGFVSSASNISAQETLDLSKESVSEKARLMGEYELSPQHRNGNTSRSIEITLRDGKVQQAYFGAEHSIGKTVFTLVTRDGKLDEDVLLLTPPYFKKHFEHPLVHWRNKKLFTLAASDIDRFEYRSFKTKLTATRSKGAWEIKVAGEMVPGDTETIGNLITALTYLSAITFAGEDKTTKEAKSILKSSKKIISFALHLKGKDSVPVNFQLYEKKLKERNQWFATVSTNSTLFEMAAGVRNRLNKSLAQLRQTRLITSLEKYSAKTLTFSGKPMGKSPLIIKNENDQWKFATGDPEFDKSEVDASKIDKFMDRISGKRIKDFLTGKRVPSGEKGGLVFELGQKDAADYRKFVFWQDANHMYAKDLLSKRKEAFKIETAVKDHLPWKREHFHKTDSNKSETSGKKDSKG